MAARRTRDDRLFARLAVTSVVSLVVGLVVAPPLWALYLRYGEWWLGLLGL